MENENNNYSFTPINNDNSVNEIKNDFFGGGVDIPPESSEETKVVTEQPVVENKPTSEVPPILETVSSVEPEKVNTPETNEPSTEVNQINVVENTPVEPINTESVEVKAPEGMNDAREETKVVTEQENTPVEPINTEPVEVKVPEGMDDARGDANQVNGGEIPSIFTETPIIESKENVVTPEVSKPEEVKKGKSIFNFFRTKETPVVNEEKKEEPVLPTSLPTIEEEVQEPVNVMETPIIEEPVIDTKADPLIEEPVREIKEDLIKDPIINSFTDEVKEEEPVKEVEPIVKEVVVEKEKVVLGKKCPNCGEITADPFCPNCGFLVE